MKLSDVMSAMQLAGYAEVALVIFFGVFVLVAIYVARGRKERFEHASRLPLDDDGKQDSFGGDNDG